jgi:DNA-binding response OmpR family regulator
LAESKTVLIIDDDIHIRRIIELKLTRSGYRVITAPDGVEGLELVYSMKPDVVITDINMPRLNGEDLCKKTNPLKKETSFLTVVMTARINPEDQNWLAEMDDTRFFEKPFSPTRLLACIDEYFINVS